MIMRGMRVEIREDRQGRLGTGIQRTSGNRGLHYQEVEHVSFVGRSQIVCKSELELMTGIGNCRSIEFLDADMCADEQKMYR